MTHHTTLRKGKRHKHAYSVKVDQLSGVTIKHNNQNTGKHSQKDDTNRKG